jgi:predicted ATPase
VSALERGFRRRPQGETIRALAAALDLDTDAREALSQAARTSAPADAPGHIGDGSLPGAPTPLVGRESDLLAVRQWLTDPVVRLVTLAGPGGAGKTRLALEVARAVAGLGPTRVLFVPLASARTPTFVASAIAEALALTDVGPAELTARARAVLGGRPTLLVLDNLEQVLDAAPLIADLLASIASLKVLATSRAPLRLRGEREYPVGPLALDDHPDDDPSPALRLFVDRVRDVLPAFDLTAQSRPVVTTICQRLDGLPLALELAAPWMKVLPADELLRRLVDDCLLPSTAPRDLPERHQTMHAAVAWSYRLLGPGEQEAFQRLGALPGPFSIGAAAAVLAGLDPSAESSDWAIAAVGELIDKSLLQRVDSSVAGRPLYRMLETVRAYAALELAGSGDRDDAMEGLARYYAGEATRAAHGLIGPNQIDWLDQVRDDLEVYRALLGWLIERERADEAAHLACHLMFFWVIRGHATEGLSWYEQILAMPLLPDRTEGQVLFAAAVMWYAQGELVRAGEAVTRALVQTGNVGDEWTAMQAENVLGHVESARGNLVEAHARFTRALAGFRTVGLACTTANALSGLAWVTLAMGDVPEAERLLDEAEAFTHEAGPWFLMLPLYLRAVVAVRQGDADRAIALTRASLEHIAALHDRFVVVYALVPFAAAAVLKGDDEWAARILGARDTITELSGARVMDNSVRDLRDSAERQVRARLGPTRWAKAYAVGRGLTVDALLDEIDARVPALRE